MAAAKNDAIISVKDAQKSAEFYHTDFQKIPGSNRGIMLEQNWRDSAGIVS